MIGISEFDKKAIAVLKCIVPHQTMKLTDVDGIVWESTAKDIDTTAVTTITKNGKVIAEIIYNYESNKETETLFPENFM